MDTRKKLSRLDCEKMFNKLKVADDLLMDVWDTLLWSEDGRENANFKVTSVLVSFVASQAIRHAQSYIHDAIAEKEKEEDRARREEQEDTRDDDNVGGNEDNHQDAGDVAEGTCGPCGCQVVQKPRACCSGEEAEGCKVGSVGGTD